MAFLLFIFSASLAAQTAVEAAPNPAAEAAYQKRAAEQREKEERQAQKRKLIAEFDRALFSANRGQLAALLDRVDPAVDRYSQFPLIVTAVRKPDMLAFLIAKGVRLPLLNQALTDPGQDHNLLNAAVREGSVESYAVLREAGLNFTAQCLKEQCYIYDIISSGATVFPDVLARDGLTFDLRRRINAGGRREPPAVAAAQSKAVLEWLVRAGADVNAADDFGRTALLAASAASAQEPVRFLLASGADVRARQKDGQGVLHVLFHTLDESTPPIADMLLRGGADPNSTDASGETPLFGLVRQTKRKPVICDCTEEESRRMRTRLLERAVGIVRLLQNAGARLDVRNRAGRTAFDTADDDLTAMLKQAGL